MKEDKEKAIFKKLVQRGENYVAHPRTRSTRGVKAWQNACVRWLRDNLPDSGLATEALLVAPPTAPLYGKGITSSAVRNVQRLLKVLFKAHDLLPFLHAREKRHTPRAENVRRVFIVHGQNDVLKTSVARLLEKLDLEPIILHEQPNLGRTIIEKFIDHSDVAFAVVLLTADDRGGLAEVSPAKYKRRARQNVILELGYFLGALGRKRVAAIYQRDVEIPSDYTGVLFIPYDHSGSWQLRLAKEIRASGISIDLNKI
jgi:predicted nucleotide-binding protein